MNPAISGPGPDLKFAIGTVPASAAGAVTGSAIDVRGYTHLALELQAGAATGTPDSFTLDAKVTHSDTEGGSYTDYQPGGTAASGAVSTISTASSRKRKVIPLSGCKGWVKIVKTLAMVGGTTPTVPNACIVALSGAQVMPSQSDD